MTVRTIRSISQSLLPVIAISFVMYNASKAPPRHAAIAQQPAPTQAQVNHTGWRPRVWQEKFLPPPEYGHYDGEYEIQRASVNWITTSCKSALKKPAEQVAIACNRKQYGKCIIFIATDEDLEKYGWDYDIVLRHELAHCSGWRHDH